MSHLNTAYKLGSLQAQAEFEDWLRKQSELQAGAPPRPVGKPVPVGAPNTAAGAAAALKVKPQFGGGRPMPGGALPPG